MEPVSFAVGVVGLAGLFGSCLEAIDRAKDYKSFETDSQALNAQFEADRLRFERWGRSVGLEVGQLSADHHELLDDDRTVSTVMGLLKFINEVCSLHGASPQVGGDRAMPQSRKAFSSVPPHGIPSTGGGLRRCKLTWAFGGKGEHKSQVELFGRSVQQLHELVPPDQPKGWFPKNGAKAGSSNTSHGINRPNELIRAETQSNNEWLAQIQQLLTEKEAQIRREVHYWLVGNCQPNDLYDESRDRKLPGTCDWILHQAAFARWSSSDFPTDKAKLLWISGQPGFGKTILCARLVEHLSSILETPIAHFFFSSDHESRNDPYVAMRFWVSQLAALSPDAFAIARQSWQTTQDPIAPRLLVVQLLREMLRDVPGCTLVVDGIDECVTLGNSANSVVSFLEDLGELTETTTRVLVVSRDESEIREILQDNHHFDFSEHKIVPGDVRADTSAYSRLIVDRKLKKKPEEIKVNLSEMMIDRCEGQFLWLKMQEDALKGWMNKTQLQRVINTTPSGLEHVYERHWDRISRSERDRDRAFSLLRWVTFALRPLSVGEVTEAVLINENDDGLLLDDLPDVLSDEFINDQILHLCSPLLELRDQQPEPSSSHRTVHLTHFTVKEFLVRRLPITGLQANEALQASHDRIQHSLLARLCLCYIRSRQTWQNSDGHFQAVFRDYAAASWYMHANAGIPLESDENTLKHMLEFMDVNHPCWNFWRTWFDTQDAQEKLDAKDETAVPGPMYYAVRLGQTAVAIRQIETSGLRAEEIEGQRSPLHQACLKGNAAIVKAMLRAGASVAARDIRGRTPVYSASLDGQLEVVKMLLQRGVELNTANDHGWTAINVAADEGHLEVVKLLVDRGADITMANSVGATPLHSAAASGHPEVVKLLVDKGADITVVGSSEETPLHQAAENGHLEVVKLLLDNGAEISASDNRGWTPIVLAAAHGHLEVVELLVHHGADLTAPSSSEWPLILLAANNGQQRVIKMLIEKGVDTMVVGTDGWTPIHLAASNGHLEVVKLLIDNGVDITTTNKRGWTPINLAAARGHLEVIKVLMGKGAGIMVANNTGWTPLHVAANHGHLEVVELLFDEGADINAVNAEGMTPIEVAADSGHLKVVKLLADKEASTTVTRDSR